MMRYKFVFAGAMGAGKTTAIRAISDSTPVSTDVANIDQDQHTKAMTTVGIDYGIVKLGDDVEVMIYGTPGQERFEFVWKTVQTGALGTIIYVDHSAENPISQLEKYVNYYVENDPNVLLVLAVTHADEGLNQDTEQYANWLKARNLSIPLFFVDARRREDISMLLHVLIALLEPQD